MQQTVTHVPPWIMEPADCRMVNVSMIRFTWRSTRFHMRIKYRKLTLKKWSCITLMFGAWIALQVSAFKLIEYFILPYPIDVVPTLSDCLLNHIDSLIQKRCNSSVLAMESCLFCIKLLICTCCFMILTLLFPENFLYQRTIYLINFMMGIGFPILQLWHV